jgi:hypothetical protein
MTPVTDRQRATWFRPGYPDPALRVSDADRAEVTDRLGRHYADGRLDQAEFDERVSRAMGAKTVGDFQGLFDDLPGLPGDVANGSADGAARGSRRAPGTPPPFGNRAAHGPRGLRRGPVRTLLLVALIIIAVNVTWHALGWLIPLAWVALIAVIIVAVARRARRSAS